MDPHPAYLQQLQEKLTILRSKLAEPATNTNKDTLIIITTELASIYQKLLTFDLNSGVEKQLEAFLWNDCFKKPLTVLEKLDKPTFGFIIDSGIGFYIALIHTLSLQFDKATGADQNSPKSLFCTSTPKKPVAGIPPSQAAINYITQHSLIHIGDLLRYRGSFTDALNMYDRSTTINPTNGHPYNQMGLVQLLIDSKTLDSFLAGVYYYVRAVGTINPFLPAQQNLESLISKAKTTQPTTSEEVLIYSFLRTASYFLLNQDSPSRSPTPPIFAFIIEEEDQQQRLNPSLFQVNQLTFPQSIHLIAVSLFCWKRESDKILLGMVQQQNTTNEDKALQLIANLINGFCAAVIKQEDLLGENSFSAMLACFCLLMEWLQLNTKVMSNEIFRSTLNPKLISELANLVQNLDIDTLTKIQELNKSQPQFVLPEEKKLFGFLPLAKAFEHLKKSPLEESNTRIHYIRLQRLSRHLTFLQEERHALLRQQFSAGAPPTWLPIPFSTAVPTIIRPASSNFSQQPQRSGSTGNRNVALQSILNQFGQHQQQPTTTNSIGRSSETLQLQATATTVAETAAYASFSSSSSPIPMSGMSSSPYPTDSTNFSLLFSSIWTPNQDFRQSSNGNANIAGSSEQGQAQGQSNIWK